MKLKVYLALVQHRHGENQYAAANKNELLAQLYAYVAESWGEFMDDRPIPKLQKAAVSQYFDVAKDFGQQGEFLTETVETIDVATADLADDPKQRKYIVARGNRCPYCDSDQLDQPYPIDRKDADDSSVYHTRMECCACDRKWVEVHMLTGFREDI